MGEGQLTPKRARHRKSEISGELEAYAQHLNNLRRILHPPAVETAW